MQSVRSQSLPADVTGYETVTITIPATSYDASAGGPQMARVKYNKLFPLVITSDDMGKTELTNNWAALNGYPIINDHVDLGIQPGGTKFLQSPYKKYYAQGESQDVADHAPMTYTDNVGKTQRYRMTCAVMPYDINSGNYAKITANDAKLMLRTGFSFAQHDVNDISSIDAISSAMTTNNNTWANAVGIGLKVMVEPNGNHNYLAAGVQNSGVCWNIFQNPTSEYPANSKTLTSWANRTDWSENGITTIPSSFSNKPTGGFTRSFFQGHESEWKTAVDAADGTSMIIGGTHGIGDDIKEHLRTSNNIKENAWVCGVDEVWEYYHIYNNVVIENISWDDTNKTLTFDVKVPTYQKNQFRELTLNIPGLTGATACTTSGVTVVTGGWQQTTSNGFTMNIGLETSINTYIDQLTNIYRDDQTNEFVKRDAQYLIDQLWDGTDKQSALDASATYNLTVGSTLDGSAGPTLATIKTDTNGEKQFAVPRYIVNDNKLYEHAANAQKPYYVNTITTGAGTPSAVAYTDKNITGDVVFYAEGEDLDGTIAVGAEFDLNDNSSRAYAMQLCSMGMGGCIVSGKPATVTNSLPRGKYKMVIGYGDSNTSHAANFYINVGSTQVYTFANSSATNQAVTEFTTDNFNIEIDNTPITIISDYTDDHPEKGSHWIDYVYIVKTANLDAIAPTVTFVSSSTSTSVKTGTTVTLTATAVPNGGSGLSTSIYASDSEGNKTGEALASGTTSVSYDFTPTVDGTSYFVAQSTNSVGTTTSSLITLTAVSIDTYTLKIVDKSGGEAMTALLSNPGEPVADPLPDAYRSPFAENYHYYLSKDDAQSNNTANALATTANWSNATIYVGYDVKSTFGSDKKFAVWANSRYMHMVYRIDQAHSTNDYFMTNQKYDISDIPSAASSDGLALHEITTSNYTLLDNHYMWDLGDDPYNVVFKNVANQRYLSSNYNGSPGNQTDITNGNRYCIIYWQAKANNSSIETEADYYRLYDRTKSINSTLAYNDTGSRFLSCTGDNNNEWRTIDRNHGSYDAASKVYIKTLPEVTINVLNSHGAVEAQIQAYNNPTATMQSFIPYSMLRAYTSGHALYYNSAHNDAVAASAVLNTDKLDANGGNLYMIYAINDAKWRTVVKDAVTYDVHSYDAAAGDNINWYGLRYNKTDASTGNYIMVSALSSNLGTTSLNDFTGVNAETDNGKKGQWALIGTPYHLELANRYLGISNLLGIPSNATTSSKAQVHAAGTSDVLTTWEVVTYLNKGKSHIFFRPQGGFNAQAPNLFISTTGGLSAKPSGGEMFDFYWAAVDLTVPSVTLTASTASVNVGTELTLTATPTLGSGSSLSNLKFWKKVDDGAWTEITDLAEATPTSGTAYAKAYTPNVAGTYTFKATVSDDQNQEGTSEEVNVTVNAVAAASTVKLITSSATPVTGTTVTLTATATPASGSTVTYLAIEQKNGENYELVGEAYSSGNSARGVAVTRASSVNNETGEVTVTYEFTADAVGTSYDFRATANFSDNVNTTTTIHSTDDVANGGEGQALQLTSSLPTPTLESYNLELIDHSGNIVFTESSVAAATVTSTVGDPLGNKYRSPFVETYKYYKHTDAGKASAQLGEDANLTDWSDENNDGAVYVGYTVKSTFSEDKLFAIWANSRYMHFVPRPSESNNNRYVLERQKYDIWNAAISGSSFSYSTISTSNFALLDNHFMWNLGDDPYRITFKNKGTGYYANPTSNSVAGWGTSSTGTYSILYWTSSDGSSTDTSTDGLCRIYYRGSSGTPLYVMTTTNAECDWRAGDTSNGNYASGSQIYIKKLPEVTINVLNSRDEVEVRLQAFYKADANMQSNVLYSLLRAYTSNHRLYYDASHTDPVTMGTDVLNTTKLEGNGSNLYLKYELESAWRTLTKNGFTSNIFAFDEVNDNDANWYAMRYNAGDRFYSANTGTLPVNTSAVNPGVDAITGSSHVDDTSAKQAQWAIIGTPYNLQITNRYHGFGSLLGVENNATTSSAPMVYASDASGAITTWEAVNCLSGQGTNFLFFRPQGGLNGQNPLLYIGNDGANHPKMNDSAGGGAKFDFYWATSTTEHAAPTATLTLTASLTDVYVDASTTLTATATPAENHNVTYFAIERETSTDVWEVAGTAYSGENVTGASKDGEGIVTVTCSFIPDAADTYTFRARSVCDNDAVNNTVLSTNTVRDGGMGSAVTVTATVAPFIVGSDNYTLNLVDKDGNILFTESNVPKARVEEKNLISDRNGDPIADSWRSPLVTRYYYYSTLDDAKDDTRTNIFDWASTAATPTVYVGYEVSDAIDLNGGKFSSLNEDANSLMKNRKARDAASNDNTQVRDASKFGKMYMLKFKTSAVYHSEDGSDKVEAAETPIGTNVYPYTNGDGPMYIYTDARYQDQKDNGASTRTRWPWYLVSPKGDPYHVYITSWQNSHTNGGTNYYSYLRTYYQSGVGVVTNNVTDDPSTLENSSQILPTDYMLLRGNGTDGDYKLMTVATINNGSTDERRTVTSLEQYWRNNPTAQIQAGRQESNNGVLADEEKTTLQGKGWHNYNAYVNAAGWTGGTGSSNKSYTNSEHWYQSIQLGDGSLDIVEAKIDGILVLLDNHGWEIMRKPIVAKDDPDYEAVRAELRKFDSPMVSQYKFYSTRNVNHKVYGYHKYDIVTNTGSKTPLAASTRVDADKTITSLADYEPHTSGGALTDLYVTYDVKPEYANSYVGAATEGATKASSFLVRQGSNYAYAANASTLAGGALPDPLTDVYKWTLKPNFNIDEEMGYLYNNGTGNSEPSKTDLESQYFNEGRNGFDPYNLQLKNVSTSTYFKTNADKAELDGGIWTGNGSTVILGVTSTTFDASSYDTRTAKVTNATFMAVQDANGNMRLMPRFDHSHVVQTFTALSEQAAAQPANNTSHAQTTLLTTPLTYHIIDNSGNDVFGGLAYTGAGFSVPKEYQSPMADAYYLHSTQQDATDNRTTSNVATVSPGDDIYISYKVSDSFNGDKTYNIWGSDNYMHASYRYTQVEDNTGNGTYIWWMRAQGKDREGGNDISTTTFPFLDNTYAWQVGDNPDPYNVKFLNKGANRYINQENTGNNGRMEQLSIIETAGQIPTTATPFCILYYGDSSDDCTLYNRTQSKYVYRYYGEWAANESRTGDSRRLTITELPAISINVVNAANEVECTLEGFYKSGCTWTNSFTPFYLQRIYTSGHTFYYTLADATAGENAISGTVNDNTVTTNGAVYVKYTLASDWGAAVDNDDLTAKKTAQTLKVMPSPNASNKINWYAIRTGNGKYLGATNTNSPTDLTEASSTNATTDADENANKLAQWAFIGTPYNLKLVDRYHGMSTFLGVNNDAVAGSFAFIDDGTADITTWEVCTDFGNNSKLLIRPQRSLNGETPYLYIGWNGGRNNMSLAMSTGGNLGLDLTWVKETDAKTVTFKLYDKDGNYMNGEGTAGITDFLLTGVSEGDNLETVYSNTDHKRRYCQYTFYSSYDDQTQILSNPVTVAGADAAEIIYVKWEYTDEAPVFSTGNDTRDYQYYMMNVTASGSTYPYMIGVDDNGNGGYDVKIDNNVGSVRAHKHQFALVGNPYSFKLYSRYADQNVGTADQTDLVIDGNAEHDVIFDMPEPSTNLNNNHFVARLKGTVKTVTGTSNDVWIGAASSGYMTLRDIIIPVHVFREGMTTQTNQMDYREYAMDLTNRSTDDRIIDSQLTETGNAVGTAHDFRHAFCDYTFYQGYDWNDGELSYLIPAEGLSYFGGQEQRKRQFFATYTIDYDAFGQIYLIKGSDGEGVYVGKNTEITHGYTLKGVNNKTEAKNDDTRSYRWQFTGDPYNLQIVNLGLGEFRNSFPLAVKAVADGTSAESEADGTLALLTSEIPESSSDTESYGQYSHWEIITKSDGSYVFWNIDEGEANRYTKTLNRRYAGSGGGVMRMTASEVSLILELPIERYAVNWYVMENDGSNNYSQVATASYFVDENSTVMLEDMPESLRRHFCEYNNMYSDADCLTAYSGNSVTITAETDVYVPYILDSGAPDFCSATPTSETAEKYWYEMGYPELSKYIYYDTTNGVSSQNAVSVSALRDFANYPYCRWALVGSPYNVKFYNKQTGTYLTSDGETLTMGSEGTSFTFFDDYTGDLCAIYDAATGTYLNASAQLQTYNTAGGTAVDFSNTYGVVKIAFVLHYSANTLRPSAANTTETIRIDTYQKLDKKLDDVLPKAWKRAFCQYAYDWGTTSTESTPSGTAVTTVNQTMVDTYNANKDEYLYVHVTYDYTTDAPFKWSTTSNNYTGKNWYYLVNNHRPGGIQGKMVHRDSDPKLRISTDLVSDELYLNNYEWCVIGDPYGFRMLNRYDPDHRFDEFISVTDDVDASSSKYMFKQAAGNSQHVFEMMPGQYSYNFWIHPAYSVSTIDEPTDGSDELSYMGQNYNGSAAILMTSTAKALRNNNSANFRLEVRSDATLKEYLNYAGMVGSLKHDVATTDDIAAIKEKIENGTATDEEKTQIHDLINDPDNIVQMTQGYYRLIPYTWEKNGGERRYVRGYLFDNERTASSGMNQNLKIETLNHAMYDPASVFWFGSTTDGSYPRYYVRTQGLSLTGNGLAYGDGFKCRYEDIGAGIMQLKSTSGTANAYDYLSCAGGDETSTNHCFDEQGQYYKTRFYLQRVDNESYNLPLRLEVYPGKYAGKDYHFATLFVPYDVVVADGASAYLGKRTVVKDQLDNDDEEDWRLQCDPVPAGDGYAEGKFVPAGTPVLIRAEATSGTNDFDIDGYDRASDNVAYYVTLNLPNNSPSAALTSPSYFKGKYLEQVLSGSDVPESGKIVYVFGQATGDNYTTQTATEVGFYKNKNTTDGTTTGTVNNLYVRHNKIYIFGASAKSGLTEEDLDNPSNARRRIDIQFGDTGIETYDSGAQVTLPTGTYDLRGQRVSDDDNLLTPGVYIRNGQKIIIRRQKR